jgi:hypothetical protein
MSGEFNFKYISTTEDPEEDCLGRWSQECVLEGAEVVVNRLGDSTSPISDAEEDLRTIGYNVEREGDSLCVHCDRSNCHTCLHISRGS